MNPQLFFYGLKIPGDPACRGLGKYLSGGSVHITTTYPSTGKGCRWLMLTNCTSSGLEKKIMFVFKCYCYILSIPVTASLCFERSAPFYSTVHAYSCKEACTALPKIMQQVGMTDGGQQGNSEIIRIRTINSGGGRHYRRHLPENWIFAYEEFIASCCSHQKNHVALTSQLVAMEVLMLPKIGLSCRAIKSPGDPAESVCIWERPAQNLFLAVAQQPICVMECDNKSG